MRTKILALSILMAAVAGCGDDDDDGLHRPLGASIDGNEVGTPCLEDTDCGDPAAGAECCRGDKCGPDGWCSPECVDDRGCPEGFVCVDHDGHRCFLQCDTDRDCPTDFICKEKDGQLQCEYKDL